jgi:hypothetical protein
MIFIIHGSSSRASYRARGAPSWKVPKSGPIAQTRTTLNGLFRQDRRPKRRYESRAREVLRRYLLGTTGHLGTGGRIMNQIHQDPTPSTAILMVGWWATMKGTHWKAGPRVKHEFDLGTDRRGIAASERSRVWGVGVLRARARAVCYVYTYNLVHPSTQRPSP